MIRNQVGELITPCTARLSATARTVAPGGMVTISCGPDGCDGEQAATRASTVMRVPTGARLTGLLPTGAVGARRTGLLPIEAVRARRTGSLRGALGAADSDARETRWCTAAPSAPERDPVGVPRPLTSESDPAGATRPPANRPAVIPRSAAAPGTPARGPQLPGHPRRPSAPG